MHKYIYWLSQKWTSIFWPVLVRKYDLTVDSLVGIGDGDKCRYKNWVRSNKRDRQADRWNEIETAREIDREKQTARKKGTRGQKQREIEQINRDREGIRERNLRFDKIKMFRIKSLVI